MIWSPRQLGELADTSRRTVRHYQDVGLLPEPESQANGYRRYGVAHLLRLVRIRRLTRLGFTLPQIAAMGADGCLPAQALRDLDAELAAKVHELQQIRLELAVMLERAAPADLPLELSARAEGLPAAERALVVVLSRLLEPSALDAYLDLLPRYRDNAAVIAFDTLMDDSDPQDRAAVASGIAAHLRHLSVQCADHLQQIDGEVHRGPAPKQKTIRLAIDELYNPAQLAVLTEVQGVEAHRTSRPLIRGANRHGTATTA